ncbi:hypothetical protein AWH62_10340 [Maricaulis sp. W15]|uniref:hypothetical protein n=1 Tax=Maricaulis sp. W15 TaxID=1772333 RepID=UPI000948A142|nr:hypothetical protein [Maricaulis sp. W15]OLF72234.1 hypothetical protein AWH62_10340 [Maricaulis sp. W15]
METKETTLHPDTAIDDGKAIAGWFYACLAVGGAIAGLFAPGVLQDGPAAHTFLVMIALIAIAVTMFLTALPAFLLVQLVRAWRLPRGFADILIPASLSPLIGAICFGGHPAVLLLAPLGALGGGVYWFAVGKPQAPKQTDGV